MISLILKCLCKTLGRVAASVTVFLLLSMSSHAEQTECVKVKTSVAGASLDGLLWEGDEIEVYGLGCGDIGRYDYVVFYVGETISPIIKQAWGLPGDTVEVTPKNRLTVNGVEVKTPFGRSYHLMPGPRKRMAKLPDPIDAYLLMGHPDSVDSTRVGLIPLDKILGYVPYENVKSRQSN